ncbi:flagellin [Clostridium beijerinckii]|uniref:flagellin n=1 Tax=Clostridium beijerinckii TaxID=1520 RepID=UPI0015701B57|nr:flagellin [Clostridium beijerinckii]NRT73679.1 flagellin [Clostridium beijerinckii]
MRLTHNMYSLSIYKHYTRALSENSTAIERTSSGKKLNSAKDNPNKIAQAEGLKMSILSRNAAQSNIQDTTSMIQTYDGALGEMNNNISRLKSLAVQAGNETNSEDDNQKIQEEMDSIVKSINDLSKTNFNGIKMSQEQPAVSKKSTIGALDGETIEIPFYDVTAKGLGLDNLKVVGSDKDINSAMDSIDKAVTHVTDIRSVYGAIQSRLEGSQNNTDEINDSLTKAQSSIMDADIAAESIDYSRTKVLIQASISLIAQGNNLPKDALNILSSVR